MSQLVDVDRGDELGIINSLLCIVILHLLLDIGFAWRNDHDMCTYICRWYWCQRSGQAPWPFVWMFAAEQGRKEGQKSYLLLAANTG